MILRSSLLVVALLCAACSTTTGGGERPTPEPSTPSETATTPPPTPPPPLPWGPTQAELDEARARVAAMTPEQVVGQVMVARYGGTDPADAASLVAELHLAGVILMGDNVAESGGVVDVDQVRATAGAVQSAGTADGRDWPAVVSVDQEGGRVARVGAPATEFPTLMTAGAARDPEVTRAAAAASAAELRALGFTWVFAPDTDVTIGPADPTIGSRSPSDDPGIVGEVVRDAVAGYLGAGIVPVAKHYPGHGSVTADSHESLPVQDATLEDLRSRDLVPFVAAAQAGVPAVMMSHIAVDAFAPGVPSSLAPEAYASLREDAGFSGLAVTDALDMAAITQDYGPDGAAVAAVGAGADLLLMPADGRAAHAALVAALGSGELPRARVDDAAAKVVALQRWQARQAPAPGPEAVGAHAEASSVLSLAGATVVDGPCSGSLVDGAVQVVGGTDTDRARFTEAAEAAGLATGSGAVVRLLGTATSSGVGDVVVALDVPYGLAASDASVARIALYGRTPGAFRALVDVLTGTAAASGHLPVAVDGLPPGAGCPR